MQLLWQTVISLIDFCHLRSIVLLKSGYYRSLSTAMLPDNSVKVSKMRQQVRRLHLQHKTLEAFRSPLWHICQVNMKDNWRIVRREMDSCIILIFFSYIVCIMVLKATLQQKKLLFFSYIYNRKLCVFNRHLDNDPRGRRSKKIQTFVGQRLKTLMNRYCHFTQISTFHLTYSGLSLCCSYCFISWRENWKSSI